MLAYAPITAAQLLLVRRDDVHWDSRELSAPGREKGGMVAVTSTAPSGSCSGFR